jgi:hypothetical protein
LQHLAADLDTGWLAVVSHLAIENCGAKREMELPPWRPLSFTYVCDRQWQDLDAAEGDGVRFCTTCKEKVHYCDTIGKAREHARAGHCVAVDLGVLRRDGDLRQPMMFLGRASAAMIQKEEELAKPDPVSAARERRLREQQAREEGSPRRTSDDAGE